MNTITVICLTITIAASTTTIVILSKGIANIRRRDQRRQTLQAHINELVEDLDKTWAGT